MHESSVCRFFLLVHLTSNLFSQQNLIYNGDFETYTSCPTSYTEPSQFPNYEINKCIGWITPTYGTSDYFNKCCTTPQACVPGNAAGYQNAYHGNGYLGAAFASFTQGEGSDGYSGNMWWEYIQGQFITPLQTNKKYP